MGSCCSYYSRLNAKLVLPHELRVGDHILIKHCYGDINAILIDDNKNRCVYLDNITGYVTETHLQTLCVDTNKLFRYDYSAIITMTPNETVANSKYFSLRGKFSKCCLTSGYQFAYNCKINKYTSCDDENFLSSHNAESLLMDIGHNPPLITSNALSLCIDNHGIDIDPLSTSNESKSNTNKFIINSAGAKDPTDTAIDIKPSLAIQIDCIYDSHNVLLQKLQSMNDEIKNIKNIQESLLGQDVDKEDEEDEEDIDHQSCSLVPLTSNVTTTKKHGSLSPVTMDTSVTLTPIRSETGNPGGNTSINYGKHLGVIVVPDINMSSSVGGQFSVIDSSMSISTTKH